MADGVDPAEGLFVRPPAPEAPDPFIREEIKQILETPTSRIQEVSMVQFMIWAGRGFQKRSRRLGRMSIWSKVRWTFHRSMVLGAYQVTKTRRSTRRVRLLASAGLGCVAQV